MTRSIRRLTAVVVLATSMLVGTAGSAGAGELCLFASKRGVLQRVDVCLPTWL